MTMHPTVHNTFMRFPVVLIFTLLAASSQAQQAEQYGIEHIVEATLKGLADSKCLNYCITGSCVSVWCIAGICLPDVSLQIRHRLPDLVVASWSGQAPIDGYKDIIDSLEGKTDIESTMGYSRPTVAWRTSVFKDALAFGNPADLGKFGGVPLCKMLTSPLKPYFSSTIDQKNWRNSALEGAISVTNRKNLINQSGTKRWGNCILALVSLIHHHQLLQTMLPLTGQFI